jgi:hypothetical protein
VTRRRFVILAVVLVALNVFFWLAQSGFASSLGLIQDLFGPRMIRAEVVWQASDGTFQDTQLARGVVRAVAPDSITLRERDRPTDTIPLATNVIVKWGSQTLAFAQLRAGMRVVVFRPANAPASVVLVEAFR